MKSSHIKSIPQVGILFLGFALLFVFQDRLEIFAPSRPGMIEAHGANIILNERILALTSPDGEWTAQWVSRENREGQGKFGLIFFDTKTKTKLGISGKSYEWGVHKIYWNEKSELVIEANEKRLGVWREDDDANLGWHPES